MCLPVTATVPSAAAANTRSRARAATTVNAAIHMPTIGNLLIDHTLFKVNYGQEKLLPVLNLNEKK
jgi:hypothetical protein